MSDPISLKSGTANTIVRNVGVYSATDNELLTEARSQDHFIEDDTELLRKLRAAQKRLQGAALGGHRASVKRQERREGEAAFIVLVKDEIEELRTRAPFAGDEDWPRIIDKRLSQAVTVDDFLAIRDDMKRTAERAMDNQEV